MKRLLLTLAGLSVLGLLAFGLVLFGCFETAADIRARYAARSPELLTIAEPVKVSETFIWLDGGTYGIELTDAQGKKHSFCLRQTGDDGGGVPPPNLFIGAPHFAQPGAKMVDVRGSEEADLYGVLLRWIGQQQVPEAFLDPRRSPDHKDSNAYGAWMFFRRWMPILSKGGQDADMGNRAIDK